jgi:hypothetical protein
MDAIHSMIHLLCFHWNMKGIKFQCHENIFAIRLQWVPGDLSLGAKRPRRAVDHTPQSSAEVKECVELYFHSPIRLHGTVLSLRKHRDSFTLPYQKVNNIVSMNI